MARFPRSVHRARPWLNLKSKVIVDRCNEGQIIQFPYRRILAHYESEVQEIIMLDLVRYHTSLFLRTLKNERTAWMQFNEVEEGRFHEAFVCPTLVAHPHPKSVWIIGGGDLLVAHEVLKCPIVERVLLSDWDPVVAMVVKNHYPKIGESRIHSDKRLEGVGIARDVRTFLPSMRETWDIIIVDLSDVAAMGVLVPNFLKHIKRSLNRDGIVVFQAGPISDYPPEQKILRANISALGAAFDGNIAIWHVPQYGFGYEQVFLAGYLGGPGYTASPPAEALLENTFPDWKNLFSFYSPETHMAMFTFGRDQQSSFGI